MNFKKKFQAFKYKFGPKYRKSYSQCGEDIIISRILRNMGVSNPIYIDIGTNDPIIFNNTYFFYSHGARGICIEPNLFVYKKIKRIRRHDTCLNIGIGPQNSTLEFFIFENDALSTFSQKDAEYAIEKGTILKQKKLVEVQTIAEVVEQNNLHSIDLLSLDTEGLDYEILKSIDFAKIRPKVLCIETKSFGDDTQIMSEILTFMKNQGYIQMGITPINSIFVDSRVKQNH